MREWRKKGGLEGEGAAGERVGFGENLLERKNS